MASSIGEWMKLARLAELPEQEPRDTLSAGEVVIKGGNVMRGYLNRPEATAETSVDGWLRTGDVGFLAEDGYLTLVDRIKDMIIRGGENVYPKEIESVLGRHYAVLEAGRSRSASQAMGELAQGRGGAGPAG
jgi:long-chain acyl-CoA synthetase